MRQLSAMPGLAILPRKSTRKIVSALKHMNSGIRGSFRKRKL